MRYDLKPTRRFKISNFTDLVIHGVLRPFYPKTRLPGPQSTSSGRRSSVAKSFQKQLTLHIIKEDSLNVDKVLPGLLLSSISAYLTNPHEHPKALGGYCRGNT